MYRPIPEKVNASRSTSNPDYAMKRLVLLPLAGMVLIAASHGTTAPRRYNVELAFVGYLGPAIPECDGANRTGYDSLIGMVEEVDPAREPGDDAIYKGRVRRKTAIDYCMTRPRSAATPDELVWCMLRLTGTADMTLEIEVLTDAGTGAYFQAEPFLASPLVPSSSTTGDCTGAEADEIRRSWPDASSGGSPDGQPLLDPTGTQFVLNNLPALRAGYSPPKPPEVTWGMRVTPVP